MTEYEIATEAARDARERAARSADPAQRAVLAEMAALWSLEAQRHLPRQPSYVDVEVLSDGTQPIRLSFQIKVF